MWYIEYMGAVKVLYQSKEKSSIYTDLVLTNDNWYQVRVYKTSKAKKTYGTAYGVTTTFDHVGEHCNGCTIIIECTDLNEALVVYNARTATMSKCKVLKLFN